MNLFFLSAYAKGNAEILDQNFKLFHIKIELDEKIITETTPCE